MENASTSTLTFPIKRWIVFNFLGWILGTALVLIMSSSFDAIGIESLQFFVAVGIGLGIGLTQWLVLKRVSKIRAKWILYTMLGLSIPFIISDVLKYFNLLDLEELLIPVCVAIGSIFLGIFQSKLLADYKINAVFWIGISFISWVLISLAVISVAYTQLISDNVWFGFTVNLILLLSGGIILGVITGIHLKKHMTIT
ncbi:hypothetical protein K6119_11005 [Paracrocinitomix mangrovi]|uniref:hypothetical protein n=1 Tax=Paracrocinitomix mangrovi TaxID=2862509 RepID=UPI001C8E4A13|nr:hypothetical protein [Paracrocinitomix mangrovi]UKN00262.1 hypothetical protein K6119_11005 [Paracrocinitomix mangrovi]